MPWHNTPCDVEARSTNGELTGIVRSGRVRGETLQKLWSEFYKTDWPGDWLQACHYCNDPRCSNPEHIYPGTQTENLKQAFVEGRSRGNGKGESSNLSVLTDSEVLEIKERALKGELQSKLATEFGVDTSQISRIKTGKRWGHIKIGSD